MTGNMQMMMRFRDLQVAEDLSLIHILLRDGREYDPCKTTGQKKDGYQYQNKMGDHLDRAADLVFDPL